MLRVGVHLPLLALWTPVTGSAEVLRGPDVRLQDCVVSIRRLCRIKVWLRAHRVTPSIHRKRSTHTQGLSAHRAPTRLPLMESHATRQRS